MNPNSPYAMPSPAAACPRCHAALPVGNDANSCPRCLLGLAATPSGSARPGTKAPSIAELQPLFPDYELEALLGRGGMGAVYRARQVRLERQVAIKVLLPELVSDPAFAGRFEREAKALARLTHPGIVGVHDFGKAGAYYFLVMEHVDGANLRDLLAQGRMTTRDVLQLVPQLCDALQYAHDHRIVHRDIKPENVLVDGDGRVRIADFGLAKLLGDDPAGLGLTQTEQAMGTPHYMAPEQMRAGRDVDHRADLYSLGVVIYEMLTGQLPIGRFLPPSARDATARGLDPVVMKSLENDPAQRYQAAAEVKRDLDRAAGAPTRGSSATAATGRALPWMTWLYVAAIAVACALPWYWVSDSVPTIWPRSIDPSADTTTIQAQVERLGIDGLQLAEPWVRARFPRKLATGFHFPLASFRSTR